MKLQKKFSLICLDFIILYLEHGYYPVDDTTNESALISKIFGFGLHQEVMTDDVSEDWVTARELPEPKKTARLDLTTEEAEAILDMMAESFPRDIEETSDFTRLKTYLTKEFIHEDATENSEG